jgi:hypothetical protein
MVDGEEPFTGNLKEVWSIARGMNAPSTKSGQRRPATRCRSGRAFATRRHPPDGLHKRTGADLRVALRRLARPH